MHQLASKEYQLSKSDFFGEDTKLIDAKMARILNLREKCLQAPVLDSQGCGSTSQQLFNLAINKSRTNLCDPVIPPKDCIQQLITNLRDDISPPSIQKDFKFYYIQLPFSGHHFILIHDNRNAFILQSYLHEYTLSESLGNHTKCFSLSSFISDLAQLDKKNSKTSTDSFCEKYFLVRKSQSWSSDVYYRCVEIDWNSYLSKFKLAFDFSQIPEFQIILEKLDHEQQDVNKENSHLTI